MEEVLHAIADRLDYPMVVVTASGPEDGSGPPSGCLVGFHSQCSLRPSLFMVWVSQLNHTHAVAGASDYIGVHFLDRRQPELAQLFGGSTGDHQDKFSRCRWSYGPHRVPVLGDCANWICGQVVERQPTGDHTGLLVRPVGGAARTQDFEPLSFQQIRDIEPGHPG